MSYNPEQALRLVESRDMTPELASSFSSMHLGLVALTAILTGGANLALEIVLLLMMYNINSSYDSKDFLPRAGIVSAGPLIMINISQVVLIVATGLMFLIVEPETAFFLMILGSLGWIGYALYLQFSRISNFRRLIAYRPRPFAEWYDDLDIGTSKKEKPSIKTKERNRSATEQLLSCHGLLQSELLDEEHYESRKQKILDELDEHGDASEFAELLSTAREIDGLLSDAQLERLEQQHKVLDRSPQPKPEPKPRPKAQPVPEEPPNKQPALKTTEPHPFIGKLLKLRELQEADILTEDEFTSKKTLMIDEIPLDTDFHELLLQANDYKEDGLIDDRDIAVLKQIYLETMS